MPLREDCYRRLQCPARIQTTFPLLPSTLCPPASFVRRARRSRSDLRSGFLYASSVFPLLFPDSALFYFFVAAPEILHHRIFTRHALQSPHRGVRQFLRTNPNFFAAFGGRGQECRATFFPRRAFLRCATAAYFRSLLLMLF